MSRTTRLAPAGSARVTSRSLRSRFLLLSAAVSVGAIAGPADPFADVEITTTQVSDHVYMLEGAGGNIGISAGADGILMVDDQFAPLADRIAAAIDAIGGPTPESFTDLLRLKLYLLNTHFHGDHTGGNPVFGAAEYGAGARKCARPLVSRRCTGGRAASDYLPRPRARAFQWR